MSEEYDSLAMLVQNLTMIVKRLCLKIPVTDKTRVQSMDYLIRQGLMGSADILRRDSMTAEDFRKSQEPHEFVPNDYGVEHVCKQAWCHRYKDDPIHVTQEGSRG